MILLKRKIWLILALALALRLAGIEYGFPNFLISDERALVFGALKMLELKTLVPAWHPEEFRPLYYMPFMSYVFLIWMLPFLAVKYAIAGFPALADFKTSLILDPSSIWIWSRALVAILGAINVYVVYLISKKIFNSHSTSLMASERAALFSALFVALSFYHVQLSHMTRHWLPAVTFTYLTLLLILYIRESDKLRNYIFGGLLGGVSFATNPSSIAMLLPFGIFHIEKRKLFSRNVFIFLALFTLCALIFILLHPFGVTFAEPTKGGLDPAGNVFWRLAHIFDNGFAGWAGLFVLYAKNLLKYETALFIFALAGFWLAFKQKINRSFLLAAAVFMVGYITVINFMLITFPRPLIMLIPMLVIFAGFGLDKVFQKTSEVYWKIPPFQIKGGIEEKRRARKVLVAAVVAIVFGYPLAVDIRYDYLLSKNDNRLIAAEWISKNIPSGSKILVYLPYTRLPNSKEGILEMQSADPGSLRSVDYALLGLPDDKYPQPSFDVLNLHFVSVDSPYREAEEIQFFKEKEFEYLIVEYAKDDAGDLDQQFRALVRQSKLIKHFPGTYDLRDEISNIWPREIFKYKQFGPSIDFFEL